MPLLPPENARRTAPTVRLRRGRSYGGGLMFVFEAWVRAGARLVLIGSVSFATKPAPWLAREIHHARSGGPERIRERITGSITGAHRGADA